MSLPLIYNLSLQELADQCQASGLPAFRAKQIWQWLYHHHVTTWDAMHNIPPATQLWLNQNFTINPDTGGRRSEVGGQRSACHAVATECEGGRSEDGGQRSEDGEVGRRSPNKPHPEQRASASTTSDQAPSPKPLPLQPLQPCNHATLQPLPPKHTKKILVTLPDGEAVEAVIIPSRRRKPEVGDRRSEIGGQRSEVGDSNIEHPTSNIQHPTSNEISAPKTSDQQPKTKNQEPPPPRTTLCISCQVGCRFNCAFCASGQAGLIRNLTAGEMVLQVIAATNIIGSRPTNVVFMGIGEPFDNYDQTLKAAHILNDPNGLKIGARKITISTSGIIPGIEQLSKEGRQFELSVSLHAPTNAIRSKLMPINNKYPLPELIEACKQYTNTTNRIITFEYTLIRDLNDKPEHAYQLTKLLRNFHCRVNLIPLSPIAEFSGEPSTDRASQMFIETLNNAHINATLRHSQGASLKAACGQLRFSKRNTK